jgi:AcrR family transcriptional regulator
MPVARGERAREAIAKALLEALRAGDPAPTAPTVAKRAGVSLRLVFHHFTDMESVWRAAAAMQLAHVRELAYLPPSTTATTAMRIAAVVCNRSMLYDEIAPVRRAAVAKELSSTAIAESLSLARSWKRAHVLRYFARELRGKGTATADAVAAAASYSFWETIRVHQGRSQGAYTRAATRTLEALLGGGS